MKSWNVFLNYAFVLTAVVGFFWLLAALASNEFDLNRFRPIEFAPPIPYEEYIEFSTGTLIVRSDGTTAQRLADDADVTSSTLSTSGRASRQSPCV